MSINIRIKELRLSKNLNQKTFSDKINIDSSQYSKVELGKLQPTLTQLMEISSFFNVSMDWLCFGKLDVLDTDVSIDLENEKFELLKENNALLRDKIETLANENARLQSIINAGTESKRQAG